MDYMNVIRCKFCKFSSEFLMDPAFLICEYWTNDHNYAPAVPVNGYCHNAQRKEEESDA